MAQNIYWSIYIYIQDTIIISSYKYSYGFWNVGGFLRPPLRSKISFSMAGARNSDSINRLFGRQNHIYLAFDEYFSSAGTWKSQLTLNMFFGLCRIYLAFDFIFPSRAEGKVRTLNIYEVVCSCYFKILSYIFSVRFHFSLTGRGESGDTKYIWGDFSIFVHIYLAFPLVSARKSDRR